MDGSIKDIVSAFKQDFKPQECVDLYKLTHQDIIFTLTKLKQFIVHSSLQDISLLELESLYHFIQNDKVIETYINELVAPFAPMGMVGKTIESEFVGSIGVYNNFASQKQHYGGTIMIAPILIVCTLIQNAYLFIDDIMMHHDTQYCLDKCNRLSQESIGIAEIYRHTVHLIIKPLYEVLNYRILKSDSNIPQFLVTSFGLIEAEYAIEHGQEIMNQIEKTLSEMLKSITPNETTLIN